MALGMVTFPGWLPIIGLGECLHMQGHPRLQHRACASLNWFHGLPMAPQCLWACSSVSSFVKNLNDLGIF